VELPTSPKPSSAPMFPLPLQKSRTLISSLVDRDQCPFSLIFHEDTIPLLKNLLMKYGMNFSKLIPPFACEAEQVDFVVMCLTLLNGHCRLLVKRPSEVEPGSSLCIKINQLRDLFFQMLDMDLPARVQQAVSETLTSGASILLPILKEKLRISLGMLDDVSNLTRGQQLLCKVIFTSLEDHQEVASILALARPTKTKNIFGVNELKWTEELLGRLLKILTEEIDRKISLLECDDESSGAEDNSSVLAFSQKLHSLLTSLQNHLFAHCLTLCMSTSETQVQEELDDHLWQILEAHLAQLFSAASNIYKRIEGLLESKPELHSKVYGEFDSMTST